MPFFPGSLRRGLGALLLVVSTGVLVAWSGSAPPASAGTATRAATPIAAQQIDVTEHEYSIEMPLLFVAGPYEFVVRNVGQAPHDLVVSRDGQEVARTSVIQAGRSATLTVTLQRGTYLFYCSVDDHRAKGMQDTVRVL